MRVHASNISDVTWCTLVCPGFNRKKPCTYSLVVKAWSNVSSKLERLPLGRFVESLVERISVGTPSRVFVVANTFCRSLCWLRGYDCNRKKRTEQKRILSDRSTFGGKAFGGGRVLYAVLSALKYPSPLGMTNVNKRGQNGLILVLNSQPVVLGKKDSGLTYQRESFCSPSRTHMKEIIEQTSLNVCVSWSGSWHCDRT